MDPIQQREWQELEGKARALINDSYHVKEAGHECLARVIVDPSFITLENWRLFRRNTNTPTSYFVKWIFWDQERDLNRVMEPTGKLPVERRYRLRSLEPRLETGEAELATDVAETLLHRLSCLAIPPYAPTECIGCDGTSYRFRAGDFICSVEYSWWQSPPEPWLPLMETVDAMLHTFRALPR